MITNNNGSGRIWMRKAFVAPVLVAAVLFFACTKDVNVAKVPPPPPPPQIVADGKYSITLSSDTFKVKFLAAGGVIKIVPMKIDYSKRESNGKAVIIMDSAKVDY